MSLTRSKNHFKQGSCPRRIPENTSYQLMLIPAAMIYRTTIINVLQVYNFIVYKTLFLPRSSYTIKDHLDLNAETNNFLDKLNQDKAGSHLRHIFRKAVLFCFLLLHSCNTVVQELSRISIIIMVCGHRWLFLRLYALTLLALEGARERP